MNTEIRYKEIFVILILSAVYWGGGYLFASFVTDNVMKRYLASEVEVVRKNIALVRANFESAVFMDTQLADSLATLVTIDDSLTLQRKEDIAKKLMSKARYIRSISIYPDDVIRFIYPLKSNEKALGLDFKSHPLQYKSVLTARKLQEVYITPPLYLAQGGMGLIARYPIFKDYPVNTQYWGGVSVVLDYTELLQNTGVMGFNGAELAIRAEPVGDDDPQIIWGKVTIFDQPDVVYPIILPNAKWTIAAKIRWLNNAHTRTVATWIAILAGLTLLAIYGLALMLYRSYRTIRIISFYDELTQVPNRWYFFQSLERLMAPGSRMSPFGLLSIDLNKFKQVNDTLGHQAGDALLKHVANQLLMAVRSSDVVARIGGDEFVVLLYRVSTMEQIDIVIANIRDNVEYVPVDFEGQLIYPSISIGAVIYEGQDMTVKQLMHFADQQMYRNKQNPTRTRPTEK